MNPKLLKLQLISLLLIINFMANAQWQNVGNAGFSAGEAEFTSLAIDGSGTPYVAFKDNGNSKKATVMKYNGSTWVTVGNAGFSAGKAEYTSLAIDGSGTPYVAYRNDASTNKATVMKYNGSSWVTVGNANFSAGVANYLSLAIDGSGTPYVSYQDGVNFYKATVMKYNGSSWVTVGNAGFSTGIAYSTSIAIDGSGTPYVAYGDYGNNFKATVMKYNGSSWVNVGNAGFSAGDASYPSLAIDGSGVPYVAYRDNANSAKATVMKYVGSSWVSVGNVGFSAGQADWISLAIDGSGTSYVAYKDYANSKNATVMKYNGSSWVNVGNAGFSAGQAKYTSLAIDGSGTPYVAYGDYGNSDKATVMKFCQSSGTDTQTACDSFTWIDGITYTTSNNTATYILTNAVGCDSLVTLDLTVNYSTTGIDTQTACDSFTWIDGITYTTRNNTATYILTNAVGCDSLLTLDLTVNYSTTGTDTQTACDSLTWIDGITYTSSNNTATYTLTNAVGCDSIVTLYLTINYSNNNQWLNVVNPGFSAGYASYTSLAFDNNGIPFVAYRDYGNSKKATVMKFDGNSWVNVGNPGFSAGEVLYTSLAFDNDGIPFVAYRDYGNSKKATVMKFDGNSWVNVGNPGFSAGGVYSTSLAFDNNGIPFVAYSDKGNSKKATVMKFDGNSWVNVGNPGFSAGDVSYTSLAFDNNGTPFVAYKDFENSDKATVMKFDGNSWVNVGNPGFSAGGGSYTSLAFDNNGIPFVAYKDYGNSGKATVMKFDGNSWVNVGNPGFSAGSADYTSLAFDNNGTPFVAYKDFENSDKATVMKFDGNSWVNVGNPGFSAGSAYYTSLAFDNNGIPFVAYSEGAYSNKATVMKVNLSGTDTQTACDSFTWIDGITYTSSNNTATYILTNAVGCDSLLTLDLTVNYSTTGTDTQTACDSFTWIDGLTYTSSNSTATHILTNVAGCDSLVTLNLTVNYSNTGTDVQTACDSFTWIDGITYTSSNSTATHILTNVLGCDSVLTLNLTVNYSNTGTDVQTACDSFTWIDGLTYTSSNSTATHILTNVAGCDSLVTLNLTVNYSNTGTDAQTACDSFTWIDGITYTSSNSQASYTLTNVAGCDSIVTLNLTVNYSNTGTDVQTACDSFTWIDGLTYTSSNSTATHILTNVAGCDSVVTLNLTVNYSNTGTDVQTACDSFTWIDGLTYNSSNSTATHILTNMLGCDSVVTLNLTVNYSNTGTDVQTACDSFTWIDGITYTSSNSTATHILTNVAGCDSIVTLNLTVNYSNTGTDVQTACDSFTWIDGLTYTSSNSTATHILTNVAGCDSVVTLNLTVNYSNTGTDVQTACDSFTWIDGITYTSNNNTATYTLTNVAGCDSIVTLDLTVQGSPVANAGDDAVICSNESYTLNGSATNQNHVYWATSGDGDFDDRFLENASYTPGVNDIENGEATLTLFAYAISPCTGETADEMILEIIHSATANAGSDDATCEQAPYLLSGETAYDDSHLWSTSGDGSFDDASLLDATYTPGANDVQSGMVELSLTAYSSLGCDDATDMMLLSIDHSPGQPGLPSGPVTVDFNTSTTSEYTIEPVTNATQYQWFLDPEEAGSISGDETIGFVNWNTDYTGLVASVSVEAQNGTCAPVLSEALDVSVGYVGTSEQQIVGMQISISPNPSNGRANVLIEGGPESMDLVIFNANGKLIRKQKLLNTKALCNKLVDISNEKPGIYYFQFICKDEVITKKLAIR
jgi:type IX secretion system substrate protein